MFDYDKPSRIFRILLTRNHMISNAIWNKFGTILLVFKKIYLCLFIPNCTRNHVITYTNIVSKKRQNAVYGLYGDATWRRSLDQNCRLNYNINAISEFRKISENRKTMDISSLEMRRTSKMSEEEARAQRDKFDHLHSYYQYGVLGYSSLSSFTTRLNLLIHPSKTRRI